MNSVCLQRHSIVVMHYCCSGSLTVSCMYESRKTQRNTEKTPNTQHPTQEHQTQTEASSLLNHVQCRVTPPHAC